MIIWSLWIEIIKIRLIFVFFSRNQICYLFWWIWQNRSKILIFDKWVDQNLVTDFKRRNFVGWMLHLANWSLSINSRNRFIFLSRTHLLERTLVLLLIWLRRSDILPSLDHFSIRVFGKSLSLIRRIFTLSLLNHKILAVRRILVLLVEHTILLNLDFNFD